MEDFIAKSEYSTFVKQYELLKAHRIAYLPSCLLDTWVEEHADGDSLTITAFQDTFVDIRPSIEIYLSKMEKKAHVFVFCLSIMGMGDYLTDTGFVTYDFDGGLTKYVQYHPTSNVIVDGIELKNILSVTYVVDK